jgi:hypothetical protein
LRSHLSRSSFHAEAFLAHLMYYYNIASYVRKRTQVRIAQPDEKYM